MADSAKTPPSLSDACSFQTSKPSNPTANASLLNCHPNLAILFAVIRRNLLMMQLYPGFDNS